MRIFNFNIFAEVQQQAPPASDRCELDREATLLGANDLPGNEKTAGKITFQDSSTHNAGFNVSFDAPLETTNPLSFDSTISADVNENSNNQLLVHYLAITIKDYEG